jgi:hypothetical protein
MISRQLYNSSVIEDMKHFWKSLNQFYWAKFKLKRLNDQQAIVLLFDVCPKLSRVWERQWEKAQYQITKTKQKHLV